MDVRDYVGKPRDSVREAELASKLRALDPEAAFNFINEYIELDHRLGLILANRSLRKKEHFEAILKRGLDLGDASSIKLWLECCLPRLGPTRVIGVLRQHAFISPNAVEHCLYWLDWMIPNAAGLDELRWTVEKHIGDGPGH